jgi:dTDP-4-dehydrorhamnose reductase
MMNKILITGANGFLGYYLTELLWETGYTVIASGRGKSRLPFLGDRYQYVSFDFTQKEEVDKAIAIHQPAIVVHCGAISKPDECERDRENAFQTNVAATIHILNACERIGARFIFLSTDFVFDGNKGMYTEEEERKAVNYYGQTKILAEDEVMQYPYPWLIVRTVLVYGKPIASRDNLLTVVAKALEKGKQLTIFADQVRTPTYVEDLAAGILRIIEKQATGIFHLSGNDILSPYQMAIAVAHYLNLDDSLITPITEKDLKEPAKRPQKTGFTITKAQRELDYQPISFAEGLARTFRS